MKKLNADSQAKAAILTVVDVDALFGGVFGAV